MAAPALFPQNFEQDTAALLPDYIWDEITDDGGDPLLEAMPFSYTQASKVRWDQYQNPYGLIPLRGVDSAPDMVTMPGLKTYEADPGFYGLSTMLRESEILFSREPNTVADPLDEANRLGVLVLGGATMTVSRFRQTGAALLINGKFTNTTTAPGAADGVLAHSYQVDGYQTLSPANDGSTGPGWAADPANADPIGDLIYWQQNKLEKGTSADFGQKSKILCNPTVINDIWNCNSVREKFKSKFGASTLRGEMPNLDGDNGLNALFTGMGLPPLVPYKKGYYATLAAAIAEDPDQFTYAIAAKSLIWLGVRPKGQTLGAWKITRHAGIGAHGAGAYPTVSTDNEDKAAFRKGIYVAAHWRQRMPHGYDIEMGFNACPILYYKRATCGITYT